MEFNGLKFQALKYGRNENLKEYYEYINSEYSEYIEHVSSTRDLGIIISSDGCFTEHIDKIVSKSRQKCGWINRSFLNKSISFRRKMWRVYIESSMDYGSQIWTPINQGQLNKLEGVLKLFSSFTDGMDGLNFWQRLEKMKLSSVQRRHERYRIFYIWKIVKGIIPNFGISWNSNSRRGRMISIPKVNSKIPASAISLREQSLSVHGGKLYNLLPRHIRDFEGSRENFKILLDEFLQSIPDQPLCEGLYPAPISSSTNRNSNSIIDWVIYLNMRDRRSMKQEDYDSLE